MPIETAGLAPVVAAGPARGGSVVEGHDLHEAEGARARAHGGIEERLVLGDGEDQVGADRRGGQGVADGGGGRQRVLQAQDVVLAQARRRQDRHGGELAAQVAGLDGHAEQGVDQERRRRAATATAIRSGSGVGSGSDGAVAGHGDRARQHASRRTGASASVPARNRSAAAHRQRLRAPPDRWPRPPRASRRRRWPPARPRARSGATARATPRRDQTSQYADRARPPASGRTVAARRHRARRGRRSPRPAARCSRVDGSRHRSPRGRPASARARLPG